MQSAVIKSGNEEYIKNFAKLRREKEGVIFGTINNIKLKKIVKNILKWEYKSLKLAEKHKAKSSKTEKNNARRENKEKTFQWLKEKKQELAQQQEQQQDEENY